MSPTRSAKIPDPEYITETVTGAIVKTPEGVRLVIPGGGESDPFARGTFAVRYAIPLIVPPSIAIVPGLLVGERGGALVGREAWDYLQAHFQVHARADAVGLMLDGTRGQYLVRELDFGVPVRVFAYADPSALTPLAELHDLQVAKTDRATLPDLLKRYLPSVD